MKPAEHPASHFDQLPPHSIEAEQCFLASTMLSRQVFEECRAIVSAASFFRADHQIIFECIRDLYDHDKPVDAVILRQELVRRNLLEEIGGVAYLAEILNSVPSTAHGVHYANIMREKAILRGVLTESNASIRRVYAACDHDSAVEIAQGASERLARLGADGVSGSFTTAGDAAMRVIESIESGDRPLIQLGIPALDGAMGGLQRGEMAILGARPSMGKSMICRQILLDAAIAGTPTLLISLEESAEKIARNLLSRLARIDNHAIRRGSFDPREFPRLTDAMATIGSLPIYIVDKSFTLSDIRASASMLVARKGVKLIIVDYLQRVRAPGKDRYAQVTEASAGLSLMFKQLDVAGFVAAQLNRDAAKRDNKRPGMFDLRESGQIEQDADQIIMLHREDYYRSTGESSEGTEPDHVAEFIFVKFRDGERGGTVKMYSELRYQNFREWVPFG